MKYTEQAVPEYLKASVYYMHEGNRTKNQLKKAGKTNTRYVTLARLIERTTGTIMAEGRAACSPHEVPNRKTGRAVAIGRALANYMETCP